MKFLISVSIVLRKIVLTKVERCGSINNMTNTNTVSKRPKYVVVRDSIRVSEVEYNSIAEASGEIEHWNKILVRWPDGTKIKVVEKNNKIHRVYAV